jgi:hypothetical protein
MQKLSLPDFGPERKPRETDDSQPHPLSGFPPRPIGGPMGLTPRADCSNAGLRKLRSVRTHTRPAACLDQIIQHRRIYGRHRGIPEYRAGPEFWQHSHNQIQSPVPPEQIDLSQSPLLKTGREQQRHEAAQATRLPPAVAKVFVKDMAAHFIGNGLFCLSVPELTRSGGIQLNRRLSLHRQFHALSFLHRILSPSEPTTANAVRQHDWLNR